MVDYYWSLIKKEFLEFLDGTIPEISKKPAHKVGPDDLLIDDNNRLTAYSDSFRTPIPIESGQLFWVVWIIRFKSL
jgi:hypothetical protein